MDKDNIDAKKLEEIEENIFLTIKEKSFGDDWDGSLEDNKKADSLIGKAIHQSLKLYEKNKGEYDDSYFTF